MPNFRYQYGDRPLEGYTIQRGVGRGGFGEVYFAVSDSGREVALKSVQQYEDIELRGIGHCMNLKNPHLVSIFDIKHTARREPFVIMEYVNGQSLRELLDQSPHGLGPVKAVYLLREMGKGLFYLHQCGVVHRDLKPHNVFIEQGLVKIGDYSLSKIMTASHRSGHTLTVGTVHYMAPEIGLGRYDHTVDIYALGVIFYEMLTGVPPFRGDSVGEVLMKHVAGEPELDHLAEPFASVIRKAMAKDPRQRYQTVDEMVADVVSVSGLGNKLDQIGIDDLSVVPEQSWSTPLANEENIPPRWPEDHASIPKAKPAFWAGMANRAESASFFTQVNSSLKTLANAIGLRNDAWPDYWGPVRDPVNLFRRLLLAAIALAFFIAIPGMISQHEGLVMALMVWIVGGAGVVLLMKKYLLPSLEQSAGVLYRFVFGAVGSLFFITVATMMAEEARRYGELIFVISICACIPLWLVDWRVMSSPLRPQRLAFTPIAGAALLALHPASMFVVAGIATAVQLASKFDPALSRRFGLSFPWLSQMTGAFMSLTRRGERAAHIPISPVTMPHPPASELLTNGLLKASSTVDRWRLRWLHSSTKRIPVNNYSAVLTDSLIMVGGTLKRFVLNAICLVLIAFAWILGFGVSVGVPQAYSHLAPQREIAQIVKAFGTNDWPQIISTLLQSAAVLLAVPAIGGLMLLRFRKSREHGLRAVLGVGLLLVSLLVFHAAFNFGHSWHVLTPYLEGGEPGYAVGKFIQEVSLPGVVLGICTTFAAVVFLLIPGTSKDRASVSTVGAEPIQTASEPPVTNPKSNVGTVDV
ncbi:MAG: serine/threonine protein kinase [Planctomycetales bacterium]|nr:serine/threonine protein kinase [Planctomycetales bacterium]